MNRKKRHRKKDLRIFSISLILLVGIVGTSMAVNGMRKEKGITDLSYEDNIV
jgi:hypothetical protein